MGRQDRREMNCSASITLRGLSLKGVICCVVLRSVCVEGGVGVRNMLWDLRCARVCVFMQCDVLLSCKKKNRKGSEVVSLTGNLFLSESIFI